MGTVVALVNVSLAVYYYCVIKLGWQDRKVKTILRQLFLYPITIGLVFAFAGIPWYDMVRLLFFAARWTYHHSENRGEQVLTATSARAAAPAVPLVQQQCCMVAGHFRRLRYLRHHLRHDQRMLVCLQGE